MNLFTNLSKFFYFFLFLLNGTFALTSETILWAALSGFAAGAMFQLWWDEIVGKSRSMRLATERSNIAILLLTDVAIAHVNTSLELEDTKLELQECERLLEHCKQEGRIL